MKIDVCSVTQGDKRYFAFMSLNYGVMADGDISTDHLRYPHKIDIVNCI
jgi:sphingosine kinase